MKSFLRGAAIAIIAILFAMLLPDYQIVRPRDLCHCIYTVHADTQKMDAVPPLVLWAWERPEDLRFINPTTTGVAFLAATVRLGPSGMTYRPRMQPLLLAHGTRLVAVVRIETMAGAALNHETATRVAQEIAYAARSPGVIAVQVDFDSTTSERAFYRDLLVELRQQLPIAMPISITALTSWCIGDRWMAGLPIDEAVPMLFRMGVGQGEVTNWMRSGHDFPEAACRTSLGISLDESWPRLPAGRRVYAFSPSSWTKRSLQELLTELKEWN